MPDGCGSLPICARAAAPGYVPATPLERFSLAELCSHLVALRNETLQRHLRALLQRLMSHPLQGGQGWFNEKVDPAKLGLPDYFRIVTKPMDLGTVKSNLSASRYAGAPEFAADVRLVFANALAYNPPANPVHKAARALSTEFESELKRTLERVERQTARTNEHACALCKGRSARSAAKCAA